ncbi:DUF3617 domain-containing protein [Ramlibacter humi]|nr:DUF3617 family protein [Ramlibacter humi]
MEDEAIARRVRALLGAAALACACCAANAGVDAQPSLKPGLWNLTAVYPDGRSRSSRECVQARTRRDLTTEILSKMQECSSQQYKVVDGKVRFEASCTTFDDEKAAVVVDFSGDLQATFQAAGRITLTKPGGSSKILQPSLSGKYGGTCDPKKYYGTGSNDNG